MSEKSQIFLTTFKDKFLDLRGCDYFLIEMKDSLSRVEFISKPEAAEFLKNGGGGLV